VGGALGALQLALNGPYGVSWFLWCVAAAFGRDLVEIRLQELCPVVDHFCILESLTHTDMPLLLLLLLLLQCCRELDIR
jgi:hypothetical protein